MKDEQLYSVKELAASRRLPISRTTIWREIQRGQMPHYRIGGQVFISERHIEQYLARYDERAFEVRRGSNADGLAGCSIFAYALNGA
jgi:excisionase family DNA binding protein